MNDVVIAGAGAVTPLGNLDDTWDGLMSCRSALSPQKILDVKEHWPVGCVNGLNGDFGSMERTSGIIRKGLSGLGEVPGDTALIVATTKGAVDVLAGHPATEWDWQPWDLGRHIAGELGLTGPVSTVSAACASGTLAVIQGALRLVQGECRSVLVVGVDILSRFVLSGFAKLHALSSENCRPFDRDRDGLSLGEGAGYLLLATGDEAAKRGWPLLAKTTGWGSACDASHITAPCRHASGLIRAIKQVAANGGVIGSINAHGTGTRFNDAMEMTAFTSLWKEPPPFHSVKGAIGHSLGAAGVIEAAVAVKSLEKGVIPPSVGIRKTEDGLKKSISGEKALPLRHPSILSCNSGFGGINAAVLFEAV